MSSATTELHTEKVCTKCKTPKRLSEFGVDRSRPSGRNNWCLSCCRKWRNENYDRHREKNREAKKAWRATHSELCQEATRRWRARNPVQLALYRVKMRAKKQGLPFNLTAADLNIPAHCPVLGIPLTNGWGRGRGVREDSPTVDRVIPSLGYVKGNVAIISGRANRIKSDADLRELRLIVNYLESFKERSRSQEDDQ